MCMAGFKAAQKVSSLTIGSWKRDLMRWGRGTETYREGARERQTER